MPWAFLASRTLPLATGGELYIRRAEDSSPRSDSDSRRWLELARNLTGERVPCPVSRVRDRRGAAGLRNALSARTAQERAAAQTFESCPNISSRSETDRPRQKDGQVYDLPFFLSRLSLSVSSRPVPCRPSRAVPSGPASRVPCPVSRVPCPTFRVQCRMSRVSGS